MDNQIYLLTRQETGFSKYIELEPFGFTQKKPSWYLDVKNYVMASSSLDHY